MSTETFDMARSFDGIRFNKQFFPDGFGKTLIHLLKSEIRDHPFPPAPLSQKRVDGGYGANPEARNLGKLCEHHINSAPLDN